MLYELRHEFSLCLTAFCSCLPIRSDISGHTAFADSLIYSGCVYVHDDRRERLGGRDNETHEIEQQKIKIKSLWSVGCAMFTGVFQNACVAKCLETGGTHTRITHLV